MDDLRTLALSRNKLETVPAGLFHGHTKLQAISIDRNNLTGIRADTFDSLAALRTLRLNGNRLNTLPAGIFEDLTGMQTLNLDDPVNLRLCEKSAGERNAVLATLPNNWNCNMVTHADLSQWTHKYIEANYITTEQEAYPGLHEDWFDVPVDVVAWPMSFGWGGAYFGHAIGIADPYPTPRKHTVFHELAHHYTIHRAIHADDPISKLWMLSVWLSMYSLPELPKKINLGENVAEAFSEWTILGRDTDWLSAEGAAVMDSASTQRIPQRFFET